jgi:competence protein ComEC
VTGKFNALGLIDTLKVPQLGAVIDSIENFLDRERDNLPLWTPVGMGIGIAFWQYWGNDGAAGLTLLCAGAVMAGIWVGPEKRVSMVLKAIGFSILIGFGAIFLKSAMVAAPILPKIWIGSFYGRIEKVEILSARDVVRLQLSTEGHQNLPPIVRVNLTPEQYKPQFQAGTIILLRARLMPPAAPALPGGYDFARRAWFQGIGATGSALGTISVYKSAPQAPLFANSRLVLTRHILDNMPAGTGAIGAALVTGDQGQIQQVDADAMRNSGMAHLLSISGLHVTAVVGFIFLLVSRILSLFPWLALRIRVPLVAAVAGAIAATSYTLLTGAEVPTVRSCIAAILILAALALGREALTMRLVAFGAVIVLLFWPDAMAGPSFQLSFAAVSTIVILHELPWIRNWTERRDEPVPIRLARNGLSLIMTGVAIEVILAPIALYHFHKTGLYGAFANVVAIPLTTFVIMPMEALALIFDPVGLGLPFWWIAGQGISIILWMAHTVSGLPGAVSMLPSMPGWAFAAIVAGALILGLLKTRVRLVGFIPFVIGIVVMLTAPRPDLLVTGDGKHLAVIGQNGDVALLRSRAGDYVRDVLLENAGTNAEPVPIEDWPGVSCSPDICILQVNDGERKWSVLATRTPYQVPSMEMAAACKRVDIVVSDRWLPWSCTPRWIKADRHMLEQSGGLVFYLPQGRLHSVNENNTHMPWVKAVQIADEQAATLQ